MCLTGRVWSHGAKKQSAEEQYHNDASNMDVTAQKNPETGILHTFNRQHKLSAQLVKKNGHSDLDL